MLEGIIIGILFTLVLGLAGAGYYLFTRLQKADAENASQGKAIADLSEHLQAVDGALTTETKTRTTEFEDLDRRLKVYEEWEIPEHLSLTDEITIQEEVRKRLDNQPGFGDSNYLDDVRGRELEEYNREFHPTAS